MTPRAACLSARPLLTAISTDRRASVACGAPASPDALNRAPSGHRPRAARAEREGDDSLRAESAYVLGLAAFWQGRLEAARANFEAAVERYRPGQQATHVLRHGRDSRASA